MALKLSAVFVDGRLNGTASLGQIIRHHHWMNLDARIERRDVRFDKKTHRSSPDELCIAISPDQEVYLLFNQFSISISKVLLAVTATPPAITGQERRALVSSRNCVAEPFYIQFFGGRSFSSRDFKLVWALGVLLVGLGGAGP